MVRSEGGGVRGGDHPNPWLERRVLCTAHRGGSLELPENTMAAFRRAVALGSEMLELDVHATRDGEVVCIHDPTVDRTTNGHGAVAEMTLEEIRSLDAAHSFVPGVGADPEADPEACVLRGVALGEHPPPDESVDAEKGRGPAASLGPTASLGPAASRGPAESLDPTDLRVPTLREVLEAFPDTLLTIEVKAGAPEVEPYEERVAALLAEHGRGDDVIIGSFREEALAALRSAIPEIHTSAPPGEARAFLEAAAAGGAGSEATGPEATGPEAASPEAAAPGAAGSAPRSPPASAGPEAPRQALQLPLEWEGRPVVSRPVVELAHRSGLAVHVWTVNDEPAMRALLDLGVDGILSDRPSVLRRVVDEAGVAYRPSSGA